MDRGLRYFHPDNADKPWVDWRKPENRIEMFMRWTRWRVRYYDLDAYGVNHGWRDATGDRSPTGKPMDTEQRYWMALLMGLTYQATMAWTIYWHFPNIWDIDLEEMQRWNVANLHRQKYAKDTKYNKGRITEQTRSIRSVIGPTGSIAAFFGNLVDGDPAASYERCYAAISQRFYKFGRMTSWLACQNLFEIAGLPIKPATMLATHPSSWSVRSGLMYLYGRDDRVESGGKGDARLTKADIKWVLRKERELYKQAAAYVDPENRAIFSNYLLESQLCQYKKLLKGGDYGGHSSADAFTRASWLRDRWPEVNYDAFFKGSVNLFHPLARGVHESKALRDLCVQTGQVINMHEDFDDLPDMSKELALDRSWQGCPINDRRITERIALYKRAQQGGWTSRNQLERLYAERSGGNHG